MNTRNKKIVLDFYRQVVSEGKHELAAQFVSPEYQDHNAAPVVGIAALLNHLDGLRKTFPDFSMQCHEAIAEGDWVAVRVTAQGTHTGEWMGIAPTGKKIGLKGINLDRVVDGLIVEHYGEADTLSMHANGRKSIQFIEQEIGMACTINDCRNSGSNSDPIWNDLSSGLKRTGRAQDPCRPAGD